MKNCTLSNGEIDAWSNYTHDYDVKIQSGCVEFKGTEEELDALLVETKDISSGVPIWDIKNGIAAAIENNVAGVDPSITFDEYVSYAKTLEGELQSYTNFAKTEEAKYVERPTP